MRDFSDYIIKQVSDCLISTWKRTVRATKTSMYGHSPRSTDIGTAMFGNLYSKVDIDGSTHFQLWRASAGCDDSQVFITNICFIYTYATYALCDANESAHRPYSARFDDCDESHANRIHTNPLETVWEDTPL